MNDRSQMLESISASLKPEARPQRNVSFDALKRKVKALKHTDPTLIKLSSIADEILAFIDKQQHEKTLAAKLDGFQIDMNKLNQRISMNLQKIADVQEQQEARIEQFQLLEAKYQHIFDRVNSVLDELEKVLKRM